MGVVAVTMSKCVTYTTEDRLKTECWPEASTKDTDDPVFKFSGETPETRTASRPISTENGGERGDNHATPTIVATSTAKPTAPVQTGSAADGPAVQTSSPKASVSSGFRDNGLSKGAVAGIAIAMLLVGVAIAGLAVFFFFKRRRNSPGHAYSDSTPQLIPHFDGKEASYVQVSQSAAPPLAAAAAIAPAKRDLDLANLSNSSEFLAGLLPPVANEQIIKSRISALFQDMQRHIDNFYRDAQASITPSMETDLARFGGGSVGMVETLQGSSMPTAAIKNALAGYILSIVSPEAEDEATLFPTEISGLKTNERSTDTTDHQAAYMIYKRLAVHLYSPPSASLHSRRSDMRDAGEHFALTFFPWANPVYNDREKDEDLVRIISNALDVSIWLFGQPYEYEYMWEGVGRRGTIVAPGLKKVTDDRGCLRERPQILLEPTVVAS